mgnify:CR=1 FL=1
MPDTNQQDAIALLKQDHRTVKALFRKFEKATRRSERQKLGESVGVEVGGEFLAQAFATEARAAEHPLNRGPHVGIILDQEYRARLSIGITHGGNMTRSARRGNVHER